MSYLHTLNHLRNPYERMPIRAGEPEEPVVSTHTTYQSSHRFPTIWSRTGFTRPLTRDEQEAFTKFVRECFGSLQFSRHPAYYDNLIYLCLTNEPFARAFARTAEEIVPYTNLDDDLPCHLYLVRRGAVRHYEAWLSVWPWLTQDLRTAMTPHILETGNLTDRVVLALFDPSVTSTKTFKRCVKKSGPLDELLAVTRSTDRTVSFLRGRLTRQSTTLQELYTTRLLLRFLPTEALDELFDDPAMSRHTPMAFAATMASHNLVQRAIRQYPMTRVEPWDPPQSHPHLLWHATIDLDSLLDEHNTRASLLALYPWALILPAFAPRIQPPSLSRLQPLLEDERTRSYADVADSVWHFWIRTAVPERLSPSGLPVTRTKMSDVIRNPDSTPDHLALTLEHLIKSLADDLVRHPRLTTTLAHRISRHHQSYVRAAIVGHPLLFREDTERLAREDDVHVRAAHIVKNTLSPRQAAHLSRDESPWIRKAVAEHPDTPIRYLYTLVTDPDHHVRIGIAKRNPLHSMLLEVLIDDRSINVLMGLAANHSCTPEVLEQLSHHASIYVRFWVATNHSTPVDTLHRMAQRAKQLISQGLLSNPNLPDADRIRLSLKNA